MFKKIKDFRKKLQQFFYSLTKLIDDITRIMKIVKRVLAGAIVYVVIFGIIVISNPTTKKENSIQNVFSNNNTIEELNQDKDNANLILEKQAVNPKTIFTDENITQYNTTDTVLKTGPDDTYDDYATIPMGTELQTTGINEYGYTRVNYEDNIVYVKTDLLVTNKSYVFTEVNTSGYIINDTKLYSELDNFAEVGTVKASDTVVITGTNDSGYSRITYNSTTYYISALDVSDSKDYIFTEADETKFAKDGAVIYNRMGENAETIKQCTAAEELHVVGINDCEYYKVSVDEGFGYILKEKVSDSKNDLYPFLTLSSKSYVEYYESNMLPGVVSTVPDSEKNDSNLTLLAKLIYCEGGITGYDGMRAVATVVVNRAYDGTMGNSISSVIYRSGQFSPVSNGSLASCDPPQEAYDAARDVLYNGYRSFPAYVLYFQSLSDGYFGGHHTYMVAAQSAGVWEQYFSYKTSDYEKYQQ